MKSVLIIIFSGLFLLLSIPTYSVEDNKEIVSQFDTTFEYKTNQWESLLKLMEDCTPSDSSIIHNATECASRLSAIPNIFPMTYNRVIANYIDRYALKGKKYTARIMALASYYFPMIEDILEEYGLPPELKYLAVIESALNPMAHSRSGAAGLWQFVPSTGRLYGLENTGLVDERRDPVKSTRAAAKYLTDLYKIYNNWELVIAAYNCGPGSINKAIRRSGGKTDYWTLYPYLPTETRNYIPAFIAVNYVMHYADYYSICPANLCLPMMTDTLMLDNSLSMHTIAKHIDVSIDELRMLNPQYKQDIIPGSKLKQFSLRLPQNLTCAFLSVQDSIFSKTNETEVQTPINQAISTTHIVRKGENLGLISKRYGISVSKLISINNLRSNVIKIGQRLNVQ
ncbi:MAG: LysM peptidoglycan-binding domain-containing protein [Bacteroidia bacterium]|nr:LysM peptidoglycan-binding domain-containing protein [Bacteroidia bacterium]